MKVSTIFYSDSGQLFYDANEAEINDQLHKLNNKLNDIYDELEELTKRCPHMHLTIKAESDTGNYCKSDDSYWFTADCRSCGKRFRVDQSENSHVRKRYSESSKDPRVEVKK